MDNQELEIKIPTLKSIRLLLQPIFDKLDSIESRLNTENIKTSNPKYYRNADLKEIFKLSKNTIVKYRETGTIPYTKLRDVYLYEVKAIEAILKQNAVRIN
jgi:hypothetical protein